MVEESANAKTALSIMPNPNYRVNIHAIWTSVGCRGRRDRRSPSAPSVRVEVRFVEKADALLGPISQAAEAARR